MSGKLSSSTDTPSEESITTETLRNPRKRKRSSTTPSNSVTFHLNTPIEQIENALREAKVPLMGLSGLFRRHQNSRSFVVRRGQNILYLPEDVFPERKQAMALQYGVTYDLKELRIASNLIMQAPPRMFPYDDNLKVALDRTLDMSPFEALDFLIKTPLKIFEMVFSRLAYHLTHTGAQMLFYKMRDIVWDFADLDLKVELISRANVIGSNLFNPCIRMVQQASQKEEEGPSFPMQYDEDIRQGSVEIPDVESRFISFYLDKCAYALPYTSREDLAVFVYRFERVNGSLPFVLNEAAERLLGYNSVEFSNFAEQRMVLDIVDCLSKGSSFFPAPAAFQ
jgi:hypothetical protein